MASERWRHSDTGRIRRWRGATLFVLLGGCASPPPESAAVRQPVPAVSAPLPDNAISEIAHREIVRRQERIRQMDEAALGASRALSQKDLEGAVAGFREAAR